MRGGKIRVQGVFEEVVVVTQNDQAHELGHSVSFQLASFMMALYTIKMANLRFEKIIKTYFRDKILTTPMHILQRPFLSLHLIYLIF